MISGWTVGVVGDVGVVHSCERSIAAAAVWLGDRASCGGLLSAEVALHHLSLAVKLALHTHTICYIISIPYILLDFLVMSIIFIMVAENAC